MHIPFSNMVKFQFLSLFLVDSLSHSVATNFVLLLCQFVAFSHFVIRRVINIINNIFTLCEFSHQADGFSLELEWQQSSSSLQDSSQYSGRSKQCSNLDRLESTADFQLFQLPFQAFRCCSKHVIDNWYQRHPHFPQPSQFSGKVQVLVFLSRSLISTLWSFGTAKSNRGLFLFLCFFFFFVYYQKSCSS